MDFKGITWVGNIYQKFEAMCLEVEEIIDQETVTYVENQVQTVGASVKRFYSDVMQDLLPPSDIDPVKVATPELSLNPVAHAGVYKKSKTSIKEVPLKVEKELPDDSKVCTGVNIDIDRTSYSGGLCSVNNSLNTSIGDAKDCNFAEGKIDNHIVDANVSIADASADSPTSDSLSVELGGTELRHTCTDCVSAESSDTCTDSELVSHIGYDITADTDSGKSAGEDMFMSHKAISGEHITGVIKKNDTTEPGMETVEQFDKLKLEESCVLVDRNKLCFVSNKEGKHKSYKKKIREALSSKMRSTRKQEYEQLAGQCEDIVTGLKQECGEKSAMPTLTMDSKTKLSTPHDFCETEWELL